MLPSLSLKSDWQMKRVFFMLNAAFTMAIMDLMSRVHINTTCQSITQQVITLRKKEVTCTSCIIYHATQTDEIFQIVRLFNTLSSLK